jgi:SAM-dependent methyltransferase
MVRVSAPRRVRWAVEALDVASNESLFEIGCGGGLAVALICDRLDRGGRITAIDRSAVAARRARDRNARAVEAGQAVIAQADFSRDSLAAAGLPVKGRCYDTIFSVNVGLFWTGPAREELALVRALLKPGGRIMACYEPPPPGTRGHQLADRVAATLAAGGLAPTVVGEVGHGPFAVFGR